MSSDSTKTQASADTKAREFAGAGDGFPVSNWDRYEFLELLGRGGMGAVYKARDRRLNRIVALKFIQGADPSRVMRFQQEARAQARIDHPHVCKVYEVGTVEGKAFIAMQLSNGQRLDHAAATLSLPEKVQVMKQVAAAMHEAHRLGIVHRDLKPSNIMVERGEDGQCSPLVMDFGLACEISTGHDLTETGALLGTPAYMAPEQARGDLQSIDRRSDVYSLGATLYELIARVAPFAGTTPASTMIKVLQEEPPPLRAHVPQLARELETIVLKCLSKEPDQRYPSARALAEDLGRYIDGEPILGQRPSLWYRLKRRVRKQRALAAVSAVSLVIILGLGIFGLRSWQQSGERARLAEDLGQQVKEIEWFLRAVYMQPLHDTSREEQLARDRMARIAARPHGLGAHGEGLVQYALGRGYLAMGEIEKANEALARAQALGIDSPELHYARGRVLGELYHEAMEGARHSGQGSTAGWQRVLEQQYLEPARESLARSHGLELESPRYVEGLIALYRRDYGGAAQAAAQAAAEAPWMYEAQKLAGDVAYSRAMEQFEQGEYALASAGLEEAGRSYAQAIALGRSDARNYEALAEAWLQRSEIDNRQGRSRKGALERALAAIDEGIQAAPLRASGYTKRAYVLRNWYRLMEFEGGGQDSKPFLTDWIATAGRAVELDPHDVYAYDALGLGHLMHALKAVKEDRDPGASWDEAISSLRHALELQPNYPWGLGDLAVVYRWKGNYQREHGQDPRAALAEAERHFSRATQVDPKYLAAQVNLVDVYNAMAAYSLSRGLDPGAELEKARQAGQQALSIDGNYYAILNYLALAEMAGAQYQADSGGDPQPWLDRALERLGRSVAINAQIGRTHLYRAECHRVAAEHAIRDGRDPSAELREARQALAEADRLNPAPGSADFRVVGTHIALAEAAWAKREGKPALPALQRALAQARRAVELYRYDESHLSLAQVHAELAEALQDGGARDAAIAEGLAQVERVLQLNPSLARAHAVRGKLLLARARGTRGAEERLEALREGQAALGRALEIDPLLRREYEALLR